jgi:hypothetical protein
MIVTSFSPTRIEAQLRALETWKKYNVPIIAVQCISDDYLDPFIPHVSAIHQVPPNTYWSKSTPSLVDIFKRVTEPTLLVNSDIELQLPSLFPITPLPDHVLSVGLRTEYNPNNPNLRHPNKYGIDTFLLTPEMMPHLTNPIWALGIPGWDYWVFYKLLTLKYKLHITRTDILHETHKEQWSKTDHRRCSRLLEFEFDIPMQELVTRILLATDRL